jgi:hypothetical protein
MKDVIKPVEKSLLKSELGSSTLFVRSPHGGCEIHMVDNTTAPNVMLEIGRVRELAFRKDGGGTGMEADLDHFDLDPSYGFKQLVAWDPENAVVLGGYRFVLGRDCRFGADGQPLIPSAHLFTYGEKFLKEEFPETIELSRSYISSEFQVTGADAAKRNIFILDALFRGVGALTPEFGTKYYLGKVTVYPDYPKQALGLLMAFFRRRFHEEPGQTGIAKNQMVIDVDESIFTGEDFNADYRILKASLKDLGTRIPPIVNSYMRLFPDMRYFGGGINDEFGNVIELGLLASVEGKTGNRFIEAREQ